MRNGVATIAFYRKTIEKPQKKEKQMPMNQSRLRVEKVSTSQNARLNIVPLIKWIEISAVLQNVIFPKEIIITTTKKNIYLQKIEDK